MTFSQLFQSFMSKKTLPIFPPNSTHSYLSAGQTMATERKKSFSPENDLFPGKRKKERNVMKSNNQINVPQAREAMDKFKMLAASEVGVNLTNGYNGHLTSREAGSVGGQMVKKMTPIRSMKYQRQNRIAIGHVQTVQYIVCVTV